MLIAKGTLLFGNKKPIKGLVTAGSVFMALICTSSLKI